ncbi:MAG TPA: ATP-binding cassette domain-containing protein, partial [Burkholderiales bacterium]|nr:ATP-binding cassette domain-containing protein [Burkholderiales bacterium]
MGGQPRTVAALKGVSFDVPADCSVALVGESGSGKSVSALAIMGLLPKESAKVDSGSRILYNGQDLLQLSPVELRRKRGGELAMIFQEPMTSLNPVFSIGFQIGEVLGLHKNLSRRQARARVIDLLNEVGIPDPAHSVDKYPFQLSGGQQQRAMIAMAIACEPKLLIADEPTTALDVTIQRQILELIAGLRERLKMSLLFITHDLGLVRRIADHVVVMRSGEIREQGSVGDIFERPKDTYTQALLACRPKLDERPVRLPVIDDFLRGTPDQPAREEKRNRASAGEPVVLEVRHLGKSFYSREGLFGQREFRAVKDVSFSLARGKTLGLVGESGSGKTTVGLTVLRLHSASGGQVLFDGKDLLSL